MIEFLFLFIMIIMIEFGLLYIYVVCHQCGHLHLGASEVLWPQHAEWHGVEQCKNAPLWMHHRFRAEQQIAGGMSCHNGLCSHHNCFRFCKELFPK